MIAIVIIFSILLGLTVAFVVCLAMVRLGATPFPDEITIKVSFQTANDSELRPAVARFCELCPDVATLFRANGNATIWLCDECAAEDPEPADIEVP